MSLIPTTDKQEVFFGGESIGTVNAISSARDTALSAKVDRYLKKELRQAVPTDDTLQIYNDWMEASYELYQQALDSKTCKLPAKDLQLLKMRYMGAPFSFMDPTAYPKNTGR